MRKFIIAFIFLIGGFFIYNNFFKSDEIKIGFVAGLSGKYSNLGHSVLNGYTLAFDEISYKIDDKKVSLIVKDDNQNTSKANSIINYFINEEINLVIGNTTSSMTKISLEKVNQKPNMLLISSSASSKEFSKKDDNFLRVQAAQSINRFEKLTKYLVKNDLKNLYVIYDEKNSSYSNDYMNSFGEALEINGGNSFVKTTALSNGFEKILFDLKNSDFNAILVIANSIDTSKLIQYLRINNIDEKIISSGWAKTSEFLENGGKYVDGVLFTITYDDKSKNKSYQDFVKRYKEKYNFPPSVFAAQGYETALIVIETLKKDSNMENLKRNILNQREFDGLQGKITFDKYGDVHRNSLLLKVKDNSFEKVQETF